VENRGVEVIESIATGIEILGVLVIGFAFVHAIIRSLFHFRQKKENTFDSLKIYIGKALLLGLEFLVAADIIRTVSIEPTLDGLLILGLLIIVRTVLSWSIIIEIEGTWPWNVSKNKMEK
jgi:uncharacterized membrane protein